MNKKQNGVNFTANTGFSPFLVGGVKYFENLIWCWKFFLSEDNEESPAYEYLRRIDYIV